MKLLDLVPLAQLSIAANLAFSEFKYDQFTGNLKKKFDEIGVYLPVISPVVRVANDQIGTSDDLIKALDTLDSLIESNNKNEVKDRGFCKSLKAWWSRVELFSCGMGDKFSKNVLAYPSGALCSWAYNKTPAWLFPPTAGSIGLNLVILLVLSLLAIKTNTYHYFQIAGNSYFISLPAVFMFLAAFFVGRVATQPLRKCLAKDEFPRGKSYAWTLNFLVAIWLIVATLYDFLIPPSMVADEFWVLISCGLLIGFTFVPIFLAWGFLRVESQVNRHSQDLLKRFNKYNMQEFKIPG